MGYLKPQTHESVTGTEKASLSGGSPRWLKRLLSVYVVFHLCGVLLAPNSDNYAGMVLAPFFRPYLYFFEMTNAWNFFSPNPEPPIYIEYELVGKDGMTYQTSRWPELQNPFFFRERQNRRVSAADFMVSAELRAEKMMVPYLCNQSPRPEAVRLWRVMYSLPSAQEVAEGKRKVGDEIGAVRKFVSHSFCDGGAA